MHEYYFKIKKGDIEFEFSTSDKIAFEEQLSDWIKGVTNSQSPIFEMPILENEDKPARMGFIEVKELVKINDIQSPSILVEEETQTFENFENILEESMENPKVEVVEKVEIITPFQAYLSAFAPQNQTDFLILTAKFLSDNESSHNFSLKQLNAKLVPATGNPIDHSVINDAIEEGLIAIVPDCTDVIEVTEYALTEAGEEYNVQQ